MGWYYDTLFVHMYCQLRSLLEVLRKKVFWINIVVRARNYRDAFMTTLGQCASCWDCPFLRNYVVISSLLLWDVLTRDTVVTG